MKLELLIGRPHIPPVQRVQDQRDLSLQIICLETETTTESTARLQAAIDPLQTDIARAAQLKRPIDEAFLQTCFDKWAHSFKEPATVDPQNIALVVLIPPSLGDRRRDFLLAIWGDTALFSAQEEPWQLVASGLSKAPERSQSAYFRLPRPKRAAFFATSPGQSLAPARICRILSRTAPHRKSAARALDARDFSQALAKEGGASSSWLYLKCEHLSRWSLMPLAIRGTDLAGGVLRRILKLPLSRKKIAMRTCGIALSALFTLALITCSRQAQSPRQQARREASEASPPHSPDKRAGESISPARGRAGFHPYSGWIAWLHDSPIQSKEWKKSSLSGALGLSGADRSRVGPDLSSPGLASSGKTHIATDRPLGTNSLALLKLEDQIKADLANLQRHQQLLAKLAEQQAPPSDGPENPSQFPHWLQEEQKRSAQHLLLARNSLEKIARRYSEWTHLAGTSPTPKPSAAPLESKVKVALSTNLLIQSAKLQMLMQHGGWLPSGNLTPSGLLLSPYLFLPNSGESIFLNPFGQVPSPAFDPTNSQEIS